MNLQNALRLRGWLGFSRDVLLRLLFGNKDDNFIGFDKYSRHGPFHWNELKVNADYRRKIEAIHDYLGSRDVCLDIGCGDGAYMFTVAGRCRIIIGIDGDYHAIRLAKEKLREHGVRNFACIQTTLGSLTRTRIALALLMLRPKIFLYFLWNKARFDVIYAMDIIEHLPDPHQLLRVSGRLVKRGGRVIIGTPLFIRKDLVSPYHVREFRVEEVQELVSSYFQLEKEMILPMRRKDGVLHREGFHISVGRPLQRGPSP